MTKLGLHPESGFCLLTCRLFLTVRLFNTQGHPFPSISGYVLLKEHTWIRMIERGSLMIIEYLHNQRDGLYSASLSEGNEQMK